MGASHLLCKLKAESHFFFFSIDLCNLRSPQTVRWHNDDVVVKMSNVHHVHYPCCNLLRLDLILIQFGNREMTKTVLNYPEKAAQLSTCTMGNLKELYKELSFVYSGKKIPSRKSKTPSPSRRARTKYISAIIKYY